MKLLQTKVNCGWFSVICYKPMHAEEIIIYLLLFVTSQCMLMRPVFINCYFLQK